MQHLTLHIAAFIDHNELFSRIHDILFKEELGVIYWMNEEDSKFEFGLVVAKEKKGIVKERIKDYLLKSKIEDFGYTQKLNSEVSEEWLRYYMPDKLLSVAR